MKTRSARGGLVSLALAGATMLAGGAAQAQPAPSPAAPAARPPGAASMPGASLPPGAAPPPGVSPMPGTLLPPAYYFHPAGPLGPREIDWEPGEPVPAGYHPIKRIRTGLVIGGAVTFGTVWLINLIPAALGGSETIPLFAPVLGPFIAIGTLRADPLGAFWLVFDGVLQAGGVAMLVAGIASPRQLLLRDDAAREHRVVPVPMAFDHGGFGIGFKGRM